MIISIFKLYSMFRNEYNIFWTESCTAVVSKQYTTHRSSAKAVVPRRCCAVVSRCAMDQVLTSRVPHEQCINVQQAGSSFLNFCTDAAATPDQGSCWALQNWLERYLGILRLERFSRHLPRILCWEPHRLWHHLIDNRTTWTWYLMPWRILRFHQNQRR